MASPSSAAVHTKGRLSRTRGLNRQHLRAQTVGEVEGMSDRPKNRQNSQRQGPYRTIEARSGQPEQRGCTHQGRLSRTRGLNRQHLRAQTVGEVEGMSDRPKNRQNSQRQGPYRTIEARSGQPEQRGCTHQRSAVEDTRAQPSTSARTDSR